MQHTGRFEGVWPITATEGKKEEEDIPDEMGHSVSRNGSFLGYTIRTC